MPESAKRALPSRITSSATSRSSLLSMSATAHALHAAVLARGADRERELAQAALEQHGVRAERDDADGQRGGKHGRERERSRRRVARERRRASGRIVGESRARQPPRIVPRTLPVTWRRSPLRRRRAAPRSRRALLDRAGVRDDMRATSPTSWSTATCSATRRTDSRCSRPISPRSRRARWRRPARPTIVNARPAAQTWDGAPAAGALAHAARARRGGGDGARRTAPAPSSSGARITSRASPPT